MNKWENTVQPRFLDYRLTRISLLVKSNIFMFPLIMTCFKYEKNISIGRTWNSSKTHKVEEITVELGLTQKPTKSMKLLVPIKI